jgi:ribonuclease D
MIRRASAATDDQSLKLDRKLSKEEINSLERQVYDGPIHVIQSRRDMLRAVGRLGQERLLGFDTETRPSFKKGVLHSPALIQLAGGDAVYIFQLRHLGLQAELLQIFANPRIIKAGVAIGRDIKDLRALAEFESHGFVDLGVSARKHGMQHHGLRGLAALLLGCRISKGARLTNWDRTKLGKSALVYAATDAWIGRRLYQVMKKHGCL